MKSHMKTKISFGVANLITILLAVLLLGPAWSFEQSSLHRQLRSACHEGDLDAIERNLKRGAEVNRADRDGWTPLMWAVASDRCATVELLLDRGAEIDHCDNEGCTALYYAAMSGYTDIMELLLERGADTELTRHDKGWTPLMRAVMSGKSRCVSILLAHGADINAKARRGVTALRLAGILGDTATAQLLIDVGATPDDRTGKLLSRWGISSRNAEGDSHGARARYADRRIAVDSATQSNTSTFRHVPNRGHAGLPRYEGSNHFTDLGDAGIGEHRGADTQFRAPSHSRLVGPSLSAQSMMQSQANVEVLQRNRGAETLLRRGKAIWTELQRNHPEVARLLIRHIRTARF